MTRERRTAMQVRGAQSSIARLADVLDRIDQFTDFDPHQHYRLTIHDTEMTATERHAAAATSVDDIELT